MDREKTEREAFDKHHEETYGWPPLENWREAGLRWQGWQARAQKQPVSGDVLSDDAAIKIANQKMNCHMTEREKMVCRILLDTIRVNGYRLVAYTPQLVTKPNLEKPLVSEAGENKTKPVEAVADAIWRAQQIHDGLLNTSGLEILPECEQENIRKQAKAAIATMPQPVSLSVEHIKNWLQEFNETNEEGPGIPFFEAQEMGEKLRAILETVPQPVEMGEEGAVEVMRFAMEDYNTATNEDRITFAGSARAAFRALQSKAHIVKRDV